MSVGRAHARALRRVVSFGWALVLGACNLHTYDETKGTIPYAQVPSPREPGGVHPLTLDVASPEGAGPFPAIVFIHGGGWVAGNLRGADLPRRIADARSRGFVGVSIAYRRADHDDGSGRALHPWPAQLQDVRCALRWLSANAAQHKIDPQRVGLWGESAGGHLAMMAAYARDDARFEPTHCSWSGSVRVKALFTMASASDPATVYELTEPWLRYFIDRWLALPAGHGPRGAPATMAEVNPLSYMASGPRVPALGLQGADDTVVSPAMQRAFAEAARLLGQDVRVEFVRGAGHDLDQGHKAFADERMWAWFRERL